MPPIPTLESVYPPVGWTTPDVKVTYVGRERGHGVVAQRDLPEGHLLCSWTGYLTHRDRVETGLTAAEKRYIIRIHGTDYFINGFPFVKRARKNEEGIGVAFMVNSSQPQGIRHTNCRMKNLSLNAYLGAIGHAKVHPAVSRLSPCVVCLYTTRKIFRGEELLFSYRVLW